MNTNDRRVRKTKRALFDALAELMSQKDLHNITIKELTDTADIHRATFYSHYQDIYELYEEMENNVISQFNSILSNDPTHSYIKVYRSLIDYISDNKPLFKMLFGKNTNPSFKNRVSKLLEDDYLKIWLFEDGKSAITKEMEYFTAYHIQGCISLIALWVINGFSTSKEDIIHLLKQVNDNTERIMP